MAEVELNTRPQAAASVTEVKGRISQARKNCTLSSLDMREASRWQGYMLNGCR